MRILGLAATALAVCLLAGEASAQPREGEGRQRGPRDGAPREGGPRDRGPREGGDRGPREGGRPQPGQLAKMLMERFDKDKDQKLDEKELNAAIEGLRQMMSGRRRPGAEGRPGQGRPGGGDRPGFRRPGGDRPRGDRPEGDRPRGDRPERPDA